MKFKQQLALGIIFLTSVVGACLISTSHASATSFNYTDFPMDDSTFRASFTMSADEIQAFLVKYNSGLANFTDIEDCGSTGGSHYSFYATYYSCGTRQKASKIIYDSARAYGINPRVILATLQKEQSLVTTPNPDASQLNCAMGYYSCGGYVGFFNQVDNGTWQFRTYFELGSGNNWWGYTPASYPCKNGGAPIVGNGANVGAGAHYYSTGLYPGNDVTFYDYNGYGYTHFVMPNISTAGLYCYTPHVFPGSAQNYFSGSYWFVYYFSQWFGSSATPYAFKSTTDSTIYLYVNGYKLAVPAMGILQDYGVSPQSIHLMTQASVDAIPTAPPSSGISTQLSYLVKSTSDSDADGGTVYLVTVGQKYAIQTFQQFTDFGFTAGQVSSVPLSFINTLAGTRPLSSFITSPNGAVFQVSANQKHVIFDYATYRSLNPSDVVTPVSYFIANLLSSGNPLSNREILVKYATGEQVFLFYGGNYYSIPTYDAYSCWGFEGTLNTPVFRVPDNSYLAPINSTSDLRCLYNDGAGVSYLLSKKNKYIVPSSFGLTSQPLSSDLITLSSRIPTAPSDLSPYIRSISSPAVWHINAGVRALVPTYSDFLLLKISASQLTILDDSSLSSITGSGVKLGQGQIVKSAGSSAVYVISGASRLLFSRSDDFVAYKNTWSNIETIDSSALDQSYPYQGVTVSRYLYDQPTNAVYLVDLNGCYLLSQPQLAAFGEDQNTLATNQSYTSAIFVNLNFNNCRLGSQYVKDGSGSAVYFISAGTRSAFSGWNSLVSHSHSTSPYIITLSTTNLQNLPYGPVIY